MTLSLRRLRNASPYRSRSFRPGGQWTPAYLNPYAWYDAHLGGSSTQITDSSGNARAAATYGAGANSPLWLQYTGTPYVWSSSVTGNRNNCPNNTAFNVTDLDVWVDIKLDSWTTGTLTLIERNGVDPDKQFRFDMTTGTPRIAWYPTGSSASGIVVSASTTAAAAAGLVAGDRCALRVTLDVDNGAGGYEVKFWHRKDGYNGTWTQLGTTTTGGATTNLPASVNRVLEPFFSQASGVDMYAYRAGLHASIGGALVADFNPALATSQTTIVDGLGNTFSIARSTSGRKSVVLSPAASSDRSVILFGTDDYATVPAAAIPPLDTFQPASTVVAIARVWNNPGTSGHPIFTTKASVANNVLGFSLRFSTTASAAGFNAHVGDGTTNDGIVVTDGTFGQRWLKWAQVQNQVPFVTGAVNNGTAVTDSSRATTVTTSTGGDGRIGAYLGGTAFIDMEFEALLTFNRAVTAAEIAQLVGYYRGGV